MDGAFDFAGELATESALQTFEEILPAALSRTFPRENRSALAQGYEPLLRRYHPTGLSLCLGAAVVLGFGILGSRTGSPKH